MSEESYKDDKLEGTVKIYDESGKIISEEFFKNGNRIKIIKVGGEKMKKLLLGAFLLVSALSFQLKEHYHWRYI